MSNPTNKPRNTPTSFERKIFESLTNPVYVRRRDLAVRLDAPDGSGVLVRLPAKHRRTSGSFEVLLAQIGTALETVTRVSEYSRLAGVKVLTFKTGETLVRMRMLGGDSLVFTHPVGDQLETFLQVDRTAITDVGPCRTGDEAIGTRKKSPHVATKGGRGRG